MEIICKQCGLVNHYETRKNGPHLTAYCKGCNSYIKNLPQEQEPKMYLGKYKGWLIKDIPDGGYLEWAYMNVKQLNERQKEAIKERINYFKNDCR